MDFNVNNENQLNEIVTPLIAWYGINKRDLPWRHNATPYRVWISEIMLQQTRVDPVIPYYLRFLETFPNVESLADASEDLLMKHWEGLGYYSRARNLQKAAKVIVEMGSFPCDFEGWLKLPGIGKYTAGAICSIALGLPTPAVDGNVLRVLSRVLGSTSDIASEKTKEQFSKALAKIYPKETSDFTQSLMELGATVCLPNGEPQCQKCPLAHMCVAYREGRIDEIPVKTPKKGRKIEEKAVLILRVGEKVAIQKRPEKGLLAKLWEFPNLPGLMSVCELQDCLLGAEYISAKEIGNAEHIFTHIEWKMKGYEVQLNSEAPQYHWVTIKDLLEEIAIPSAFRFYLQYLMNQRYEEL